MKFIILPIVFVFLSFVCVQAEGVTGVYKTEETETGSFLEIEFGPCDEDPSLSCGIIVKAYESVNNVNKEYEHTGKIMVANMKSEGSGKFSGGTIWDPSENKVYNSKMTSIDKDISVEGCILIFCRAQLWKRVK
tara:strand:- start:616 stop:1017 length:402 start_codon:yes stop_codon:yes gene_type:complete